LFLGIKPLLRSLGYRNFCNKLWNASRYVLMNTEEQDCGFAGGEMQFSLADRWITSQLQLTIQELRHAMDTYRFDQAAEESKAEKEVKSIMLLFTSALHNESEKFKGDWVEFEKKIKVKTEEMYQDFLKFMKDNNN
jgi:hypothetical protein